MAANVQDNQQPDQTLARLRAELAQVQSELSTVSGNMARAKTDAQYEAISTVFEELKSRQPSLKAMIAAEESKVCRQVDAEREVAAALNLVCRLAELVADAERLDLAAQAFNLTNARLFLRFQRVLVKKRVLNKVCGGVVTFGAAPPPVELYRGPTGRRALKHSVSAPIVAAEPDRLCLPLPPETTIGSGLEGNSLRNVNRGERI